MAKRAKPAVKSRRPASKSLNAAAVELLTLLDFVRYAMSRFIEAKLVFAHGTTDPLAEAAFLVCATLHLDPDQFETFATARVTAAEAKQIFDVIARRIATRRITLDGSAMRLRQRNTQSPNQRDQHHHKRRGLPAISANLPPQDIQTRAFASLNRLTARGTSDIL